MVVAEKLDTDIYLTVDQATKELGLHRTALYRLIDRNEIYHIKRGKSRLIQRSSLQVWKERNIQTPRNATIIAVANNKGGVAKTTSCVGLSAALRDRGKSVLVVDLDPQANLSALCKLPELGLDSILPNSTQLFVQDPDKSTKESIGSLITQGRVQGGDIEIDYISTTEDLEFIEGRVDAVVRNTVLRDNLRLMTSDYDYILLDCPPGLGYLTISAITTADRVIMPVDPEKLAIQGLHRFIETIRKISARDNRIVPVDIMLVKYRAGRPRSEAVHDQLREESKNFLRNERERLLEAIITHDEQVGNLQYLEKWKSHRAQAEYDEVVRQLFFPNEPKKVS